MSSDLSEDIQVLSLNDKEEEAKPQDEAIVPHVRQMVQAVIDLWKEDPDTEDALIGELYYLVKKKNPNWDFTEQQLEKTLKEHGFIVDQTLFTFAEQITSTLTPNLSKIFNEEEASFKVDFSEKSGKGLYAKRDISKGEVLWKEEPFIMVPPIELLRLVKHGKACTYCGKPMVSMTTDRLLKGLDCNVCNELWCSIGCKRKDLLHPQAKHGVYGIRTKGINSKAWLALEDFCIENDWSSVYAAAIIYARELLDKSKNVYDQFHSMAKISQTVRDQASSLSEFEASIHEGKLAECHQLFNKCFPKKPISYETLMEYVGTYNINNVDNCLFLVYAHLNHSCDRNVSIDLQPKRADGLQVTALRDIAAGEQLTTTYVSPTMSLQDRQRELRLNWGFICECSRCVLESKQREKRRSSRNSTAEADNRTEIREMLKEESVEFDMEEQKLEQGKRRRSVRFNETVIAHSNK
ncbi:Histone H4 methyltransferase [Komagataella phaffii CBS 7435]|uniref:Histone-lysine N-methyltransferase SET5 n=2 Tax=Komagataella phaffii TaxID=460519 RepID=C4R5W5_KOMPG|nr:Zinc-finger protein of unknown function [Komagataella phaffii GS115]AOA64197.1 GQ67_04017T0 [Komagataella phaffii]CAH2449234.1 Histone H4 methyltransferase [Komagataella phaffii CBS 7435]AOA69175.1 GQ68_03990T0 [Komagataella phaffii GS115]CAY70951.1 Zinc-finger protein of unknown function [Komagataella phaffii GS115]CCA39250.1 Histone H4 methyltransferase [Komagataella phaffii CBS 7435]